MNTQQYLHWLFETGGRHPITTDEGITLSYHPAQNMIAAGHPHHYINPHQIASIGHDITTLTHVTAIATATRLGRSAHTLKKTAKAQWYETAQYIIEFMWKPPQLHNSKHSL